MPVFTVIDQSNGSKNHGCEINEYRKYSLVITYKPSKQNYSDQHQTDIHPTLTPSAGYRSDVDPSSVVCTYKPTPSSLGTRSIILSQYVTCRCPAAILSQTSVGVIGFLLKVFLLVLCVNHTGRTRSGGHSACYTVTALVFQNYS